MIDDHLLNATGVTVLVHRRQQVNDGNMTGSNTSSISRELVKKQERGGRSQRLSFRSRSQKYTKEERLAPYWEGSRSGCRVLPNPSSLTRRHF